MQTCMLLMTTVYSFTTIIDQLMSTVLIQKMATKVQDIQCHSRVSRSTEWTEVYLNDEPGYLHQWSRQPSTVHHAVLSEWCAYQ